MDNDLDGQWVFFDDPLDSVLHEKSCYDMKYDEDHTSSPANFGAEYDKYIDYEDEDSKVPVPLAVRDPGVFSEERTGFDDGYLSDDSSYIDNVTLSIKSNLTLNSNLPCLDEITMEYFSNITWWFSSTEIMTLLPKRRVIVTGPISLTGDRFDFGAFSNEELEYQDAPD